MIEAGRFLQQRYRIDKQIGQGGMGAVYIATDERFGSTVAIKETLCMDDNFRRGLEREARLLNSLKHSALPRVSDHFEEDNGQFLVMEYIPGDDMASMLESDHASFTVEQILKWADQLLDALDYLHNQVIPVIHRDIKPQNLKINSRGEAILLDFGLAKGNPTDASHQTAAKSIFGYSRNYASLEQIQGTGTDPRSDLYSLAATLYHLLTKVPPEDALTRAMSVLSQKGDPLLPASSVNSRIPRGVAGVLQKALDLNASERPSSATQMSQMLRDSNSYAYLAEEITFAAGGTNAQVFAQPTKLMPEETRAAEIKQTDIKTEVLPGFASQLTSMKPSGVEAETNLSPRNLTSAPPPRKRRGFAVAAAALSVLLVGAAVAGGIYVVKPSVFGLGSETGNPTTALPVADDTNTATTTNADSIQAGSEISVPADTSVSAPPEPAPGKPAETTKNRAAATDKPKTQTGAGDELNIEVDDPNIPAGGIVITDQDENGKVTTMRVNPMNRPPNMQNRPPNMSNPFPRGIDWSKLTPQQRRKLQNAIRNGRMPPPNPNLQRKP